VPTARGARSGACGTRVAAQRRPHTAAAARSGGGGSPLLARAGFLFYFMTRMLEGF